MLSIRKAIPVTKMAPAFLPTVRPARPMHVKLGAPKHKLRNVKSLDTAPRVSTAKVPLHPVEELLASMKATDPNILQEGSLLALVDQYINCVHLESGCKAFLDALAATLIASTQPLPASAEDLALILVLLKYCVQKIEETAMSPAAVASLFKVLAAVRFDDHATHKVHFEAFAGEQLASCLNTACTVHGIDFETIVEIHEAALLICVDLPVLRQYNAYFKARTSSVNCGGVNADLAVRLIVAEASGRERGYEIRDLHHVVAVVTGLLEKCTDSQLAELAFAFMRPDACNGEHVRVMRLLDSIRIETHRRLKAGAMPAWKEATIRLTVIHAVSVYAPCLVARFKRSKGAFVTSGVLRPEAPWHVVA